MAKHPKSFFNGLVYFLNILVALALLLAYLAYYVNPQTLTLPAFFGLAYPGLLLLNLLFILYWIIRVHPKVFLSVFCVVIGYLPLMRLYQISGSQKAVNPGQTLKLMSYNVRLFNKYEWLPPRTEQEIAKLIAQENPDVLFLQEYYFKDKPVDFGYPHRYQIFRLKKSGSGLVIFSKYPLLKTGSIRYGVGPDGRDAGRAIFADIELDNRPIRLVNAHLASVGFDKDEYARLENPNAGNSEEIKRDFLKIIGQLNKAFIKRAHQVGILKDSLNQSPHPVILAGDFNDTPHSFTYQQISSTLKDAYLSAGSGFSKTYAKSPVPLRIDHVFYSEQLEVFNYQVIPKEFSDHYPLTATFEWQ
jgi:endonuclease/exonuclease/phosphatase family metal-dependent hydrolase